MTHTKITSHDIITLCQTQGSALAAIHLLWQAGEASSAAVRAIYERVMADHDIQGAYYLAQFALQVDDMPYDGAPLIQLIMDSDDEPLRQKLLAKMPTGSITPM